jgi:hemolysin activation/secretion protein
MSKLNLSIILLLCFFSSSLLAGGTNAGEILEREKRLRQQQNLPKEIPKAKSQDEVKTPAPEVIQTLFVKGYTFSGNTIYSQEVLSALVTDYQNKEIKISDIQTVLDIITNHYRNDGYMIAMATLPEQNLSEGVIQIHILEGKIDPNNPVKIQGTNLRMDEDYIKEYFSNDEEDFILNDKKLTRNLLNFMDNPGMTANVELAQGDSPDTTQMVVVAEEGPLVSGSLAADNFGDKNTAEYRTTAFLNINDPWNFGDQFTMGYIRGTNNQFDLYIASYDFPIGKEGLRTNLSYSNLDYDIRNSYSEGSGGEAENFDVDFRYPLIRDELTTLTINTGLSYQDYQDKSNNRTTTDNEILAIKPGITLQNTDNFMGGGFTYANITHTFGDLDMNLRLKRIYDQGSTGAKTEGSYNKTNISLFRLQSLTENTNLTLNYNQQFAFDNLDGAEKFSLGGTAGVRAYPGGEGSGDTGHLVQVDIKHNLFEQSMIGAIQASVFYDYGHVKVWHDDPSGAIYQAQKSYELQGWGLGLEASEPGVYQVSALWADKIGSNDGSSNGQDSDGTDKSSRFWVQGTFYF